MKQLVFFMSLFLGISLAGAKGLDGDQFIERAKTESQLLCFGSVYSISAFGNGANSLELLADIQPDGHHGLVAFQIGTPNSMPVAVQSIFSLLAKSYPSSNEILISFVRVENDNPRITGVYLAANKPDNAQIIADCK